MGRWQRRAEGYINLQGNYPLTVEERLDHAAMGTQETQGRREKGKNLKDNLTQLINSTSDGAAATWPSLIEGYIVNDISIHVHFALGIGRAADGKTGKFCSIFDWPIGTSKGLLDSTRTLGGQRDVVDCGDNVGQVEKTVLIPVRDFLKRPEAVPLGFSRRCHG